MSDKSCLPAKKTETILDYMHRVKTMYIYYLSLSRPVDTKTDFNLNNNIIATLSLISISSVKKFAGKCPDTYSNLISTPLDGCQSWW